MKSFFENYGFVILSAIVIIILIGISTPIGTLVRENISHIVDSFGNKTSQRLDYAFRELQKGDVIEIAGKEFTIIEQTSTHQYKVLANYLINNENHVPFNPNGNNTYKNSEISKYLNNDVYNSLSDELKNAIVETTIQQMNYSDKEEVNNKWKLDEGYLKNTSKEKIFIPSWDEIIKIYGANRKSIKDFTLNTNWVSLRDAFFNGHYKNVLFIYNDGALYDHLSGHDGKIRPAMVLDLSKIEYTVK